MIAELVELAKEVAAEAIHGQHFTPALNSDELAFCDAVASNEFAGQPACGDQAGHGTDGVHGASVCGGAGMTGLVHAPVSIAEL